MPLKYARECEICKILSSATRMNILECLKKKSLTVSQIIAKTNIPQSVVSQHLAMMRARGIVECEKKGNHVYYELVHREVLDAFDIMKRLRKKIQK